MNTYNMLLTEQKLLLEYELLSETFKGGIANVIRYIKKKYKEKEVENIIDTPEIKKLKELLNNLDIASKTGDKKSKQRAMKELVKTFPPVAEIPTPVSDYPIIDFGGDDVKNYKKEEEQKISKIVDDMLTKVGKKYGVKEPESYEPDILDISDFIENFPLKEDTRTNKMVIKESQIRTIINEELEMMLDEGLINEDFFGGLSRLKKKYVDPAVKNVKQFGKEAAATYSAGNKQTDVPKIGQQYIAQQEQLAKTLQKLMSVIPKNKYQQSLKIITSYQTYAKQELNKILSAVKETDPDEYEKQLQNDPKHLETPTINPQASANISKAFGNKKQPKRAPKPKQTKP